MNKRKCPECKSLSRCQHREIVLTVNERTALWQYKRKYPRLWKAILRTDWKKGTADPNFSFKIIANQPVLFELIVIP